MAIDDLIQDATRRMDKSVEAAQAEFSTLRTGRASPALLDRIQIDYYGQQTPLKQLATIGAPEPRMLTIQPFDPSSVATIERAIQESDLGLTPSNDGKLIRLPIPQLTEERRKELVKVVRQMAEDGQGRRPQRAPRRDPPPEGARRQGRGRQRRGAPGGGAGPEAHGRPRPRDRRAAEAQGSGDHGGLGAEGAEPPHNGTRSARGQRPHRRDHHGRQRPLGGAARAARSPRATAPARRRCGARSRRRSTSASRRSIVYAFSTENWSRPEGEVEDLMEIFGETIERELPDLARAGRARALPRPPRPRAGRAARADGGPRGRDRPQRAAQPLDRVRLRRPRRARRGGEAARRGRRGADRGVAAGAPLRAGAARSRTC